MRDYISDKFKMMIHGADYNPDHWLDSPEILAEDMRLMKLSHSNEMTVGIFAWTKLEPQEGVFDFEWLDKIFDDVYKNGGRIILATPSAAKPAWMAKKYPEMQRVDESGHRKGYGERASHCPSSPIFREKVKIISQRLAEHYKDHPALIAWHLSNEYGAIDCHCELCAENYRRWLKKKYGTIDNLNKQWWSAFWSHTFTDWSEIDPPSYMGDSTLHGKTLDWQRFRTDIVADFIKEEYNSVKEITPEIPVTTNLMGFYSGLDYRKIAKEVDFVSWDSYPVWVGEQEKDIGVAELAAMTHDLMRSLKKRPFYLMESTPSNTNWMPINKLKRPGIHMLSSMQALAHGSDSVQYFQWRKSRGSSEKLHGAVVDHAGNENTRVFKEVAAVGERLEKLSEIVGTVPNCKVGLMYDWDNLWALDNAWGFQRNDKKQLSVLLNHYRALWKRGIDVDLIGAEDNDFSKYKVIIAPMRYTVSEELGAKLEAFVKDGGTLLAGYTFATVNENDLCYLGGFPGADLRKVFGIWNEEIDTLYPDESNTVILNDGTEITAKDYCELIHLEGATALATYGSDFYRGLPAVTVNSYGKGKAYYVAFRDTGDYTDRIIGEILSKNGITSQFDGTLPHGVTAHSRTDGEAVYVFLENCNATEAETETALSWTEVDTGRSVTGKIILKPYETLILKRNS